MNLLQETRVVLTLILLACIGLIATAFYMEYQLGLEPCPMCIVQRIAVAIAGVAALIGILHNKLGKFYLSLTGFFSFIGRCLCSKTSVSAIIATRQSSILRT